MLTLPIKKKWFYMMLEPDETKRKPEEYRELNEYWGKRFATALGFTGKDAVNTMNKYIRCYGHTQEFFVRYRNGYSANSPTAEARISLSIGKVMVNAYELSEKKNKIIEQANYLRSEIDSNIKTVLLTDEEVLNIVDALEECVDFINERLKTAQVIF